MEDVVVIGGGVVGCAVADALSAPGRSVWLVERGPALGTGVTSRNSEVIHGGLYYATGSHKATTCVRGRHLLYELCAAAGVTHQRIGKLIVATEPDEEPRLEALLAQAHANGATDVRRVSRAELHALEPEVRAIAALLSPSTGIVSAHELTEALAQRARERGAQIVLRTEVTGLAPLTGGWRVDTVHAGEPFALEARAVVNAAGLHADRIAALAGIDPDAAGYRVHYWKGVYFRASARARRLVRHLVYPLPSTTTHALGVHVCLDVAGGMKLGPDASYLPERTEDYTVPETRRDAFLEAARRYLPGLRAEDLSPDQAGIRPRLYGPGGAARDFVIAHEAARGLPGLVNLLGIESPGLTASMAIGERVRDLLGELG